MPMPAQAQSPKTLQFNREAALSLVQETIEQGPYIADLLANQQAQPASFHYIITRKGNCDVVDWGVESSLEAAREIAGDWLRRYNSRPRLVA